MRENKQINYKFKIVTTMDEKKNGWDNQTRHNENRGYNNNQNRETETVVIIEENWLDKGKGWLSKNKKLAIIIAIATLSVTAVAIFWKKIKAFIKKKGDVTVEEIKQAAKEAKAEAEACENNDKK